MDGSQPDTQAKGTPFKSPLRVLVRFFQRSRDGWKHKYQELKRQRKRWQNEVADLRRSRDHWKEKAKALEQQLRSRQAQAAGTAGPDDTYPALEKKTPA